MDRYQALSKMCLNNWHYINEKLLTFHDEINFFTGHSGSGKSTVLDALQIVLYADSNGRGFFNKAAKEDSDRTLIEYLRGMKVVQENNDISYLRNKNFSTTIVLEFQDTETHKYQSLGVIFDVDVSVNDVSRMFFWHAGELAANRYREGDKVFSINELKDYIQEHYAKEDYYFSRTNEKFRNELYSNYFGGLHPKHFPALFKKAIPFKMDMKLEDFVKNYICTENDIHMEDMQDSVAQYTRLKRRLEDTKNEIRLLTDIKEQYGRYTANTNQIAQYQYNLDKLDISTIEAKLDKLQLQHSEYKEDIKLLEQSISDLEQEVKQLQEQRDEVAFAIQNSGYEHLEAELGSLNQMLELLYRSKASYDKTAEGLSKWLDTELIDTTTRTEIEHIKEYYTSPADFVRVKTNLAELRGELEKGKNELAGKINELRQKISDITKQMTILKNGQKAYPNYLLEAKDYITRELEQAYEMPIRVDILADVIEVDKEQWLNAVEGYMGNNKLNLIVPSEYAKHAMELYRSLDPKKYYKVAVIDTESVLRDGRPNLKNSLAEEVAVASDYTKAYIDYLMGAVIKCSTMEELRNNKSGITSDCVLYQGYKLQHINPRNYTEEAYIGRSAIERRLRLLEKNLKELQEQKEPLDQQVRQLGELLQLEYLQNDAEYYSSKFEEIRQIQAKEQQKEEYKRKIAELKKLNIDEWKAKKLLLEQVIDSKSKQKEKASVALQTKENDIKSFQETILLLNEELLEKQKAYQYDDLRDEAYQLFMKEQENKKTESIRSDLIYRKQNCETQMTYEFDKLLKKRELYRDAYAYRGFSLTGKDNKEYDQLLDNLSSDKLNEFTQKANEQAVQAIYHFKTDFIYKIRDSIKEVMQQKEDLNRILAQLDFGKDKYKFIITKNKGEDGKFYDMFMDENLEINPHQLTGNMNNQMDMFSMQHEKDYSDLINELIDLFMPPESSDPKALEEARENMEKYSDYRTYLSFDMEQLVEGMPPMRLSRMLSKNSGGEGQNPLYVALLASFAQVYRINLKSSIRRRPTPRLVVLDEAFSKMDAEKVGSCIGLIRKLGFQAIISATNDKIQNYVDNVDKTFVFANPNKNRISVQEFEKKEFADLLTSQEGGEDDAD
ncbi:MAG TPA: SbcC/MukB-like Walker B domain-containing protein [Mobilitalea sp.]|nr:SbcC/MukB-like Walker B domain-containing protein [Mobilitalea sp.]